MNTKTEDVWSFAAGDALDRLLSIARQALRAPAAFVAAPGLDIPHVLTQRDPAVSEPPACPESLWRGVIGNAAPFVMGPLDRGEPLAAGAPLGAFLGVPLVAVDGHVMAALCVTDTMPRHWDEADAAVLAALGRGCVVEAEHRRATAALERETKLRQDAEAAAAAARFANDTVLVDVNHELRTPLQAIIGFTEFLKTETRPDVVRTHALTIQNAGKALLSIVNQLLDLAGSVGATTMMVERTPTNIKMLAETCHAMVTPLAMEKDIVSSLTIEADVPALVFADGPKIQQVIVNFLNNAIKFTESGTVALHVSAGENSLRFSVSDTGIGIPQDKLELLFQRFSRIEADRRSIRGTGLGLAIAKQIVESMNGAIGVTSNPDRGTTFWFEIQADPLSAAPLEPVFADQELRTPASGARILIADDLDLNRKLIADMLSLEGHETDCVGDGAAALRAAGERRYDLILMDMIMPVMDGLAATRAIRALPAPACDVPIIALTAHSFKEQLDSCIAAGMDATLTKPMSLDVLTATVRSWTQGRSQAA